MKTLSENNAFAVKELDLSLNLNIGLTGAQYLSGMLSRNTSLTYFNLAQTGITPAGCNLIIQGIIQNAHSSVIKVDLRHNHVGEEQIANMCILAEMRKCLCFVEVYPYKEVDNNGQVKEDDGWLSYEGWVKYSLLRELLERNAEYMKNNPKKLQKKAAMTVNKTPTVSPSTSDTNLDLLSTVFNSLLSTISTPSTGSTQSSDSKKEIDDTELSFDNDIFSLSVSTPLKSEAVTNYLKLTENEHNHHFTTEDDSSLITCSICYEDKKPTDGTVFFMEECDHRFCCACIFEYVKDKIQKGEVDSIKCPECDRPLTVMEVKQILNQGKLTKLSNEQDAHEDDDLFSKFEEFSLKRALGGMKDLVWCPNPKCGNAIIVETSNSQNVTSPLPMSPQAKHRPIPTQSVGSSSDSTTTSGQNSSDSSISMQISSFKKRMPSICVHCSHCTWDFCSKCMQKWHPGLSCEENEAKNRTKQDELFKEWMKDQGAKICPTCGAVIQKTRGCNSMMCSQCNTKFCYFCGKSFSNSEKEHYKSCYKWSLFGFNL